MSRPGSPEKNTLGRPNCCKFAGYAVLQIRDIYPGSWFIYPSQIPNPVFLHIPDPGSRGKKGTGSRIRNTADKYPNPKTSRAETDPERCLNGAGDRCGRGGRAGVPPPAQPAGISAPGARRAAPPSLSRLRNIRLKGQCHEINNFFEGLKINTFCKGADGF
jgi:hypothetical protein